MIGRIFPGGKNIKEFHEFPDIGMFRKEFLMFFIQKPGTAEKRKDFLVSINLRKVFAEKMVSLPERIDTILLLERSGGRNMDAENRIAFFQLKRGPSAKIFIWKKPGYQNATKIPQIPYIL